MCADRSEQIQAPDGEENSGAATDEREQNAFAQHLPHHLHPSRPEREANGKFTLPRARPRQEHGGEIRAGNEEDEADRADQNHERAAHSADDQILHRIKRGAEFSRGAVVIWESRIPAGDNGIELGLRLGEADSRFEPGDDAVAARAARFQLVFRERDWFPDIGALGKRRSLDTKEWERKFKLRRHDSDDGVAPAIDRDLLADELGIGIETPPPEAFADDDDVIVPLAKFALVEDAAFDRLHTEERKQTRRHRGALDALGHVTAGKIEVGKVKRSQPIVAAQFF